MPSCSTTSSAYFVCTRFELSMASAILRKILESLVKSYKHFNALSSTTTQAPPSSLAAMASTLSASWRSDCVKVSASVSSSSSSASSKGVNVDTNSDVCPLENLDAAPVTTSFTFMESIAARSNCLVKRAGAASTIAPDGDGTSASSGATS